jgi:hypothetical protein
MEYFLDFLDHDIPFAFAHFNDGEMSMIIDSTKTPPSREQQASIRLSNKLKASLIFKQENYFPGIPCSVCYPHLREHAITLLRNNNKFENNWHALSFHHTKIVYFKRFIQLLQKKKIHWVVNQNHNLSVLKEYNLDVESKIIVPNLNAFDTYDVIVRHVSQFENGSVVILLCGCLARILAQEWFATRPDVTFLCLGSYFDSHIRNKHHLYDNINHHKECVECYNKKTIVNLIKLL